VSTVGAVPFTISIEVAPPKSYTPVPTSPLLSKNASSTSKSVPVSVMLSPAV